jgi:hypothetical protein
MYTEMSNPYARTYQTTTSDRAARKAQIQSALQQNQQLQQLIKTQDDVDILTEILGQMNMGQMNMGQMNMGQMNNMNNMDMSKGGKSRLRRSLKRRSLKRKTTKRRR